MVKPIFIIRTKHQAEAQDVLRWVGSDLTTPRELNQDYHVLVVCREDSDSPELEVLNAINATDIELEELKARVLTQLNEKKDVEQS